MAALVAVIAGGCEIGFTDRAGYLFADNRSGVPVLERITKAVSTESTTDLVSGNVCDRLVIARQLAGGDLMTEFEVLAESCDSLGRFFGFASNGSLSRIYAGPTATLERQCLIRAGPRPRLSRPVQWTHRHHLDPRMAGLQHGDRQVLWRMPLRLAPAESSTTTRRPMKW